MLISSSGRAKTETLGLIRIINQKYKYELVESLSSRAILQLRSDSFLRTPHAAPPTDNTFPRLCARSFSARRVPLRSAGPAGHSDVALLSVVHRTVLPYTAAPHIDSLHRESAQEASYRHHHVEHHRQPQQHPRGVQLVAVVSGFDTSSTAVTHSWRLLRTPSARFGRHGSLRPAVDFPAGHPRHPTSQ